MSKIYKAGQVRDDQELARILEDKEEKDAPSDLTIGSVTIEPELLDGLSPELREQLKEYYLEIINKGRRHLRAARVEAEKIKDEARTILEEVRVRAEKELEKSRVQIQKLREEAFQKGLEEGRKKGREEGLEEIREEFSRTLENLNNLHEEYKNSLQQVYQNLDENVVRLSLNLAEKIAGTRMEFEPELLVKQIEDILKDMTRIEEVIVRVNPEDYNLVNARSKRLAPYVQGEGGVRVIKDGQVEKGGFVLETPDGGIDARLSTRMELLEKTVREVVASGIEGKGTTDKSY